MKFNRTQKIGALVVNAIRRLQDIQGSTSREISNYISQEYDVPGPEIRKQVHLALRRGVSYGILQRSKGGCYTSNREYLDRQPMDSNRFVEACQKRRGRKHRSRRRSRHMKRSCRGRSKHRRRGRRRSRGRSGKRKRGRSGKRKRGRSRRGCRSTRGKRSRSRRRRKRRRRGRRSKGRKCGPMELAMMANHPNTDGELARDESQTDGSSASGSADEKHLDEPIVDEPSIIPPDNEAIGEFAST